MYHSQEDGCTLEQDYSKAQKFNNTSRLIDDLEALNNGGILVKERE